MTALYEEVRPKTYAEVVGQDKPIRAIDLLRKRGFGARAILFSGGTGTGKTTLAKLIAAEWAGEWATIELDAKGLDAGDVDDLARKTATPSMFGKGGWCIILNEVQALSRGAVTKLLTVMESSPLVCWILTTTAEQIEALFPKYDGDYEALIGRCNRIPLSQRGLCEAFAKLAQETAVRLGLDGQPFSAYVRRVKDRRNNMRAVLCDIEAGAMLP